MILQTNIPFKKETYNPITYNANVCLFGSCFSEHIGEKLSYYKFKTFQNPFGILFHPKAIENVLVRAINQEEFTSEDIFYENERWHCFEAHSAVSNSKKEVLLSSLNTAVKETYKALQEASHIIITLGTAWTYRYIETDTIVANCHKVSQKKFLKELRSVEEVAASAENCIALLKRINQKITTIFTVSPMRHLKDGFVENQQSKAHLLAGIHQVVDIRHQIHYFPSYEIMMDELRDYRFYTENMIHPNATAIKYIWEKFTSAWISHESETTMKEVETIQKGLAHKPFNPNAEQHQQFLTKLQAKTSALQTKFPFMKF